MIIDQYKVVFEVNFMEYRNFIAKIGKEGEGRAEIEEGIRK
jgi:hypothetical protein